MSPGQAVSLWNQFIDPLHKRNYQLISPATTSGGAGDTWMEQFIAQCKNCHIDGMAIHYYGTDPQAMIKYVENRYNKYKLPIWITEFACQDFGPARKQCSSGGFLVCLIDSYRIDLGISHLTIRTSKELVGNHPGVG
jgi:hypothetical protein